MSRSRIQLPNVLAWSLVVTTIGLGVLLRLLFVGEPPWLDELHTGWCIDGEFGQVAERAAIGNQPPLYFWLTWLFYKGLEPSVFSLRLLSFVMGACLLLVATAFVFRQTRSIFAAALVAFLIAFDESFVFYATEARPYVAVQLFGLIQAMLFWRLLQKFSVSFAIAFVVATCSLFYFHYTSVWLPISEVLFVLWSVRFASAKTKGKTKSNEGTTTARQWIFIGLAISLICVPAVFHLLELMDRKGNWTSLSSPSQMAWNLMEQVLLFVVPAILLMAGRTDNGRRTRGKLIALLIGWAVVPHFLVVALAGLQVVPLGLERYVQVGAVAFPILISVAFGDWLSRFQKPALWIKLVNVGIVGVVLAVSVWQNPHIWRPFVAHSIPTLRQENWQEPIREANSMAKQLERDDLVPLFLFANVLEDSAAQTNTDAKFQQYLAFPVDGIYKVDSQFLQTIPCPTLSDRPFTDEQVELVRNRKIAFLMIRATPNHVTFIVEYLLTRLPECRVDLFRSPNNHVVLISIAWE